MSELGDRIWLGEVVVEGVKVPTYVTASDGKFVGLFRDDEYTADTLSRLKFALGDAIISGRHEIPFVHAESGREGVIRGYHATSRELLVTWSDGTKGKIRPDDTVFRPVDAEEYGLMQEIRDLNDGLNQMLARRAEIKGLASKARELLADAVGQDLTAFARSRGV